MVLFLVLMLDFIEEHVEHREQPVRWKLILLGLRIDLNGVSNYMDAIQHLNHCIQGAVVGQVTIFNFEFRIVWVVNGLAHQNVL